MKQLSIGLLFIFLATSTQAKTIHGTVTRITDGDTVTFVSSSADQFKIRLNAIDAPEKKQAFSKASRRSLAVLCLNQSAKVITHKKDKYGRLVGDLFCNGVSANKHQVENGLAWVFRKYSRDAHLLTLERIAHNNYLGLWSAPSPIPPWEWRKAKREGKKPSDAIRNESRFFKQSSNSFDCSKRAFCRNMVSCDEAKFYLNKCGAFNLDGDGDGLPCESLCH